MFTSAITLLFGVAYGQAQTPDQTMMTELCIELVNRFGQQGMPNDPSPVMSNIQCEEHLKSQNITEIPVINFTERALESAQANQDWLDKRMENSEREERDNEDEDEDKEN